MTEQLEAGLTALDQGGHAQRPPDRARRAQGAPPSPAPFSPARAVRPGERREPGYQIQGLDVVGVAGVTPGDGAFVFAV